MTKDQRVAIIRSDDAEIRAVASAAWESAPESCAIAICNSPRVAGDLYCMAHGPKSRTRAAPVVMPGSSQIVCPHCQVKGRVSASSVKQKKGISGAKATGALFTGGISLLGTGLSRKEKHTQMHCGNCGTTWVV